MLLPVSFRTLRRSLIALSAAALLWTEACPSPAAAAGPASSSRAAADLRGSAKEDPFRARKALFDQLEAATGIPWFRLAAFDQYERSLTRTGSDGRTAVSPGRLTAISVPAPLWCGPLNPDQADTSPASIAFFGGFGLDGSGDGRADPASDLDVLYSLSRHIRRYGATNGDFPIAVWEYYRNGRATQRVTQFASLYAHYGRLNLSGSAFPLPLGSTYSYRSTWGTGRSWGGARIHEGTDLFTPYGVTVRSTCYGIVETKGWNRFGGWRIGIRDIENRYHYYAHLSGFDKSLEVGSFVEPGRQLGWAGSSGYGQPGTQGKFPPHLHYGIYRDRGLSEWAFDPYPLLRQWETTERRALRTKKQQRMAER
ncbi:M23 family metallopeptidase [Paenibacillus spiritus]|uniref:M23 family metallopeptidase n=1 Tax=Paenibacillus spiritus TaxID=2496557 RepID=A0A5J5GKB5_9BACL|nr:MULTISPECIES: M23 family metallopeptidase [Paenibacillus]KAA9008645.1 M23 family metallopeptidase [Paenibacillus spiritus]